MSTRSRARLVGLLLWMGWAGAWATTPPIDRKVYLPSDAVHLLTSGGKPAVLLSPEEYDRLLAEAGAKQTALPEVPFPAALATAVYEATLESSADRAEDCLALSARYRVEVLSATWGEVPFNFSDAAPTAVEVDGHGLVVGQKDQAPARLLVYGPGPHEVVVRFLVRVHRRAAGGSVAFTVPTAPSALLNLYLPGRERVESPLPVEVVHSGGRTTARLALGGRDRVEIRWSPDSGTSSPVNALFFAQTHLAYEVAEGLIRISGGMILSTMMGDLPASVVFDLPDGGAVRELSGDALQSWHTEGRRIVVERTSGALDRMELRLQVEVPASKSGETALPIITVPDAFRHYGELALVGSKRLWLDVLETRSLEAIEPESFFGAALDGGPLSLATYRFFSEPFALRFRVDSVSSELEATVSAWVLFRRDAVYLERRVEFLQKKGDSAQVRMALPQGEEFLAVYGADGEEIDAHPVASATGTALRVDLPELLPAGQRLVMTLQSRMHPQGYDRLDETGTAVVLRLQLVPEARRVEGTLALGAEPSLRLSDVDRGELEPAPRPEDHPDALQSFYFRQDYRLSVQVARKPSEVDALVLMDALPGEAVLTLRGEVRYSVSGSERKDFSVAFPRGLGRLFYPEGDGIVERSLDQSGESDTWRLSLKDPVSGEYVIRFSGHLKMNGAADVPEVKIPGARRERGYILVEANTETEIKCTAQRLSAVDVLDVPQLSSYTPVHRLVAAYRYFLHPYSLRLAVTRHASEPLLSAMADRLDLSSIVSADGLVRTRALYQVRGVRTPFLEVVLPVGSRLWSSVVADQPVKPMSGPGGSISIPLGSAFNRDSAIPVELVYETSGRRFGRAGDARFIAPRLLGGLPVGESHWSLYLPDEYLYSDFDSDLSLEPLPEPRPLLVGVAEGCWEALTIPTTMMARSYRVYDLADKAPYVGEESRGRAMPRRQPVDLRGGVYFAHPAQPAAIDKLTAAPAWDDFPATGELTQDAQREYAGVAISAGAAKAASQGQGKVGYDAAQITSKGDIIKTGDGDEAAKARTAAGQQAAEELKLKYSKFQPSGDVADVAFALGDRGRYAAGIVPFRVELQPRGVEYQFHGLREPDAVSLSFRRVDNWNAWRVFLVGIAALIFAALVHEQKLLRRSLWAIFLLTAIPSLFGAAWIGFCNRLLFSLALGVLLALVLRIRRRWSSSPVALLLPLLLFTGAFASAAETQLPEGTVYIPYNKDHPATATAERRVLLPYDRFEALWAMARARLHAPTEPVAPLDYALSDAEYTLELLPGLVNIRAELRLVLPKEGWQTIALPFRGAEMTEASLDGAAARIETATDGYRLYVHEPGAHRLRLDLVAPVESQGGGGSLRLGIPRTFAAQARLVLPTGELTGSIQPDFQGQIVRREQGKTLVLAALGSSDSLQARWWSRTAGERLGTPASANVLLHHSVLGALENWEATVHVSYPGDSRSSIQLQLDPTLSLTQLRVPNLASWNVTNATGHRILNVELASAQRDEVEINLVAERQVASSTRALPRVEVVGARRTDTRAVLCAAPMVDLVADAPGWSRVARPEGGSPGLRCLGAFETPQTTAPILYQVVERPQEIDWRHDYVFQLDRRKVEMTLLLGMEVRRRPLYNLTLEIPADYTCEKLEGELVKEWRQVPAADGAPSHLLIQLSRGVLGKSELIVHLVRHYESEPASLTLSPVRVLAASGAEYTRTQGTVLLAAHVSVQPRIIQESGLLPADLGGSDREAPGARFEVALPLEKKLAYRIESPDFYAQLALSRVEPRFSAEWAAMAQVHETWVQYDTRIRLRLRQGSRRTWEFQAPAALGEIQVSGARVREVSSTLEGDWRRYSVLLDSEVFQEDTLELAYETPIGASAEVPHLRFPGADRTTGYLLFANSSPYELTADVEGALEAAPLAQFPFQPEDVTVLGSYQTHGETWKLVFHLQRTVDAETLAAVIDWLDLETLMRPDGSRLSRGRIRMQNKTLQFLPIGLPAEARLLSLFVAGEASKADREEVDGKEMLLFPLIKTAPGDLSFEIEFTYEEPGKGALDLWQRPRMEGPRVQRIPVGQTFWTFYAPEELNLHRPRGNMQETARLLAESEKLVVKEQELQRLKQVVVRSFQISSQKRAVENYAQLEEEIRQQQSQYNQEMLQQEVARNQRLDVDYDGLASELAANSEKLQRSLQAGEGEEWRKRVVELQQQAEPAVQRAGALEAEGRVRWQSPTATPAAGDKAYEPTEGITSRGDVVQMGRDLYLRQDRGYGDQKAKAERAPQASKGEKVSAYFHLSQVPAQRKYAEKSIEDVNKDLRNQLGNQAVAPTRPAAPQSPALGAAYKARSEGAKAVLGVNVQDYGEHLGVPAAPRGGPAQGVRFMGGSKKAPTVAGIAPVEAPQLRVPEAPAAETEARRKAEARARVEGAYSIAVPFPTTGRSYTFKKMKGDPEIAFTLLHQQVAATAARFLYWILGAGLFWLLLRVLSLLAIASHLRRYAYLYVGAVVLVVVMLNVPLGLALAVVCMAGLIVYFARKRLRSPSRSH